MDSVTLLQHPVHSPYHPLIHTYSNKRRCVSTRELPSSYQSLTHSPSPQSVIDSHNHRTNGKEKCISVFNNYNAIQRIVIISSRRELKLGEWKGLPRNSYCLQVSHSKLKSYRLRVTLRITWMGKPSLQSSSSTCLDVSKSIYTFLKVFDFTRSKSSWRRRRIRCTKWQLLHALTTIFQL